MKNCIIISLSKEKITLRILGKAEQEEIVDCLNRKIQELKNLYKEDNTPIFITGKVLKNKEMEEIKNIIQKEINVEIEFDSPKVLGLHGIKKTFNEEIESSDTKFYKNSLRSGQRIEYEGSIVILGDVNGGAEVIAGENIAILGILRGLAHAGAKGNKKAIIAAASIESPQIRISNILKEREQDQEERKTFAYIENDELILQ